MIDHRPVRAFLEPSHLGWGDEVTAFAQEKLAGRPEPHDDEGGRIEARALLELMGRAGIFRPIGNRDLRAACLAREAVAAASPLADAVWALQGLGVTPLLLAGSEALRKRWVGPALQGDVMTGFAMTEPEAGTDVASMRTRAVRDGDHYVLDGKKWLISNAGIADLYVVFATTDAEAGRRGIGAFAVEAEAPGLEFAGAQVMSTAHPLGILEFRGCRVPAASRIGAEGEGFEVGMATLDRLRPTVGAAACGMAARAVREALRHALEREQFGRPLAEFQLVREKLGRRATELDAARLLVYRAAWEEDRGAETITAESAMAKAFATEAAQEIIDEAIQIVGGRGVLASHPLDRLYRSIRALRIYEGSTEIQRLIVASRMVKAARAAREAGGEEEGEATPNDGAPAPDEGTGEVSAGEGGDPDDESGPNPEDESP